MTVFKIKMCPTEHTPIIFDQSISLWGLLTWGCIIIFPIFIWNLPEESEAKNKNKIHNFQYNIIQFTSLRSPPCRTQRRCGGSPNSRWASTKLFSSHSNSAGTGCGSARAWPSGTIRRARPSTSNPRTAGSCGGTWATSATAYPAWTCCAHCGGAWFDPLVFSSPPSSEESTPRWQRTLLRMLL